MGEGRVLVPIPIEFPVKAQRLCYSAWWCPWCEHSTHNCFSMNALNSSLGRITSTTFLGRPTKCIIFLWTRVSMGVQSGDLEHTMVVWGLTTIWAWTGSITCLQRQPWTCQCLWSQMMKRRDGQKGKVGPWAMGDQPTMITFSFGIHCH